MKSNTLHLRQEAQERRSEFLTSARSFLASVEALTSKERAVLKDLPETLEAFVKALRAHCEAEGMVLDAEIRLLEALPESLHNIPLDHPVFGGRIPRKVKVIHHRYDGPYRRRRPKPGEES